MLFIATCTDKPDSLQLRLDTRPAHLAYLNGLGAQSAARRAPCWRPTSKASSARC